MFCCVISGLKRHLAVALLLGMAVCLAPFRDDATTHYSPEPTGSSDRSAPGVTIP